MASPPASKRPTTGGGGFFDLFRLGRRRQYSEDGSSRRGRRYWDRSEDYSVGKDSSTHSNLFDLELSTRGVSVGLGDDRSGHGGMSRYSAELHAKIQRIAYLSRPVAGFEVDLLHQVALAREACARSDGQVDLMALARRLHALGYACSLQRNDPAAIGDGSSTPGTSAGAASGAVDGTCLEKLRHSFIVCTGRRDGTGTAAHYCIVDPQFRDQFRIGQPTEGYNHMLAVVPAEFVGSPLRLQALADLLCTEIVEVYREQGLPLPPWRKSAAMLSRWFDVSGQAAAAAVPPPPPPPPMALPPVAVGAAVVPGPAVHGGVPVSLDRVRSGGWSDLATIQETPSPHVGASALAGSNSDLFTGGASRAGTSPASSASDAGRQRGSVKMVSLLARGLSGLGIKSGSARKNRNGTGPSPSSTPSGTKQLAQR